VQKNKLNDFKAVFGHKFYTHTFEEWIFTEEFSKDLLLSHFGTASLKGFGVENITYGVIAAGVVLHYLTETHHDKIGHISKISRIEEDRYVWLDRFTIRNLELLYSPNEGAVTLIDVIDNTVSPMGSRLLKRWITLPLKDKKPIEERFKVVEFFVKNQELIEPLQKLIKSTGDLERLISKVAIGRINPREVLQVREALKSVEQIRKEYEKSDNESVRRLVEQLNPCLSIRHQIERTLKEDAPVAVNKGNVIAEGFSKELDDLRNLAFSGKDYLVQIQQREIERTGITSLKIGYNNVFGYYLEVTNVHKDKVPEEWHRKQTLTSAERYITEELKEYEQKILGAEEKILVLESKLFADLVLSLVDYIKPVQLNAQAIGKMDVLLSFALTAIQNSYVKPEVNESFSLDIKNGRHPVIEKQMPIGEEYIPNDVHLDNEKQQILIITGPNMSGKSALLRQTALIVLLAQIGSFVPAESAVIGLVDKIFTRVGASDNISSGESTFMVEMNETSSILNNISNRSLILLDEIGRGTSTYDGISIAWAIAEFLHEHPMFRAKVLFATHYHELNEMAASFSRIKNFHVSIKEIGNKVIFLRKLKQGGSEHSFGIHVAKMAGMPQKVIERAKDLLQVLEKSHSGDELKKQSKKDRSSEDSYQLSFIQLDDPLLLQIKEDILNTDINTLTPVEALMKLNEIKKLLGR
jgi:DNA mismatch repair protein MutS